MERWIAETIESVISQEGDFEIEYIIVDGGSSDKTSEIIRDFQSRLDRGDIRARCRSFSLKYIQQKTKGMYGAINEGFTVATGDIYAWIGGDDVYRPHTALAGIANWFSKHSDSLWVKGICGFIDSDGRVIREGVYKSYNQKWLQKGIYGRETYFVEQESTFWCAELWKKVAPIPVEFRSAGDYWLNIQFAHHAPLESIKIQTTYFRTRPDQISARSDVYRKEQAIIMPNRDWVAVRVRLYSIVTNTVRPPRWICVILFRALFPFEQYNF